MGARGECWANGTRLPVLLIKQITKANDEEGVETWSIFESGRKRWREPHPSWLIAFLRRLQSCFVDRKPKGDWVKLREIAAQNTCFCNSNKKL